MNIDFDAETLQPLMTDTAVAEIERILTSLRPDLLGDRLIEEELEDEPERRELDLTVAGALGELVRQELKRAEQYLDNEQRLIKAGRVRPSLYPRRRATLSFETLDGRKNFIVRLDEYRLIPRPGGRMQFANHLTLQWRPKNLKGESLSAECRSIYARLFENSLFEYGYCCLRDEYWEKNIDRTGGGAQAVGLDVAKYLPGFYWGNYFGRFLCERIGEEKLRNVPGCTSNRIGAGVLATNKLPPDQWQDPPYVENTSRAMDHIGRDLFFEKGKELPTGPLFPVEGFRGLAESRSGC